MYMFIILFMEIDLVGEEKSKGLEKIIADQADLIAKFQRILETKDKQISDILELNHRVFNVCKEYQKQITILQLENIKKSRTMQ